MNLTKDEDGKIGVEWAAAVPVEGESPIAAVLQGGLVLSEDVWQEWLDEALARGYPDAQGNRYRLVVVDTLMMVAGDVEENRAQEMTTKIFKPMKEIARKHDTSLIFIHHMRKGGADGKRGGQRMLGSVANHAWAEDSMYLTLGATRRIEMELESKSFASQSYIISGVGHGKGWQPVVENRDHAKEEAETAPSRGLTDKQRAVVDLITGFDHPPTSLEIAQGLGYTKTGFTGAILKALEKKQVIAKLPGRPMRWATQ
jgi:hypothetical protein